MATIAETPHGKRRARPADLGELRTIMAADRTLMAWMRTALSMLSFGFTIYKFLQALAEKGQIAASHSPQRVGTFLAVMGTAAMILGTASYWATLKDLNRVEEFRLTRPILIVSMIMTFAGIALVIGIVTRLL